MEAYEPLEDYDRGLEPDSYPLNKLVLSSSFATRFRKTDLLLYQLLSACNGGMVKARVFSLTSGWKSLSGLFPFEV